MNIESKLWCVFSMNIAQVAILQKASGAIRYVSTSALPSAHELAMVHEPQFDTIVREAFHSVGGR